jgi:hypothetical protein
MLRWSCAVTPALAQAAPCIFNSWSMCRNRNPRIHFNPPAECLDSLIDVDEGLSLQEAPRIGAGTEIALQSALIQEASWGSRILDIQQALGETSLSLGQSRRAEGPRER